jgi:hypothetical protein
MKTWQFSCAYNGLFINAYLAFNLSIGFVKTRLLARQAAQSGQTGWDQR